MSSANQPAATRLSGNPAIRHRPAGSFGRAALLFVLLAAGFLLAGSLCLDRASRDTAVYEAVCAQLLANTTEGRQALVSSLWWPPLPFLVRLPLAALFSLPECPLASVAAGALFAAATLILSYRVLHRWLPGRLAFLLVATLAVAPPFVRAGMDGSATTLLMFLMLLTAYGTIEWLRTREVRFLVYAASGCALLLIAGAEAVPWVLLVLALLVADALVRPAEPGQKQAVVFLALLPPVYTAGLWLLMNWLIMGDPFYLLRSLVFVAGAAREEGMEPAPPLWHFSSVVVLAASLPLLLIAGRRCERTGLVLACTLLLPLVPIWLLQRTGIAWLTRSVPAAMLPLAVVTLGYLASQTSLAEPRLRRWLLIGPGLAVTAAWLTLLTIDTSSDRQSTFAANIAERQRWLPLLEQRVGRQTPYPKIFVCGYDSFALLGPSVDPAFVPALDFNFPKAESDYYGHQLYVLIHRPAGRSAMESVLWKYARIYSLGGVGTLYDSDWGPWRLFAIVQAPP